MQIDLFPHAPIRTIVWDNKKMPIDEAIKLVKLQIKLAPSFGKYRSALAYLETHKGNPNA